MTNTEKFVNVVWISMVKMHGTCWLPDYEPKLQRSFSRQNNFVLWKYVAKATMSGHLYDKYYMIYACGEGGCFAQTGLVLCRSSSCKCRVLSKSWRESQISAIGKQVRPFTSPHKCKITHTLQYAFWHHKFSKEEGTRKANRSYWW